MKRLLFLTLAFSAIANSAYSQGLKAAKEFPSTPDKAVGVVIADKAGGWLVFASPSMRPVAPEQINGGAGIVWEGSPGAYLVFYFPAGQQIPQPQVIVKTLGGCVPTPPDPTPNPPPTPTPDPTPQPSEVVGPAYLIVVRKSEDLTADQEQVLAELRTWSDGRSDVDHQEFAPDATGEAVASYVGKIPAGKPLPWIFVSRARKDGRGATVIWSGPLPAAAADLEKHVEDSLSPAKLREAARRAAK